MQKNPKQLIIKTSFFFLLILFGFGGASAQSKETESNIQPPDQTEAADQANSNEAPDIPQAKDFPKNHLLETAPLPTKPAASLVETIRKTNSFGKGLSQAEAKNLFDEPLVAQKEDDREEEDEEAQESREKFHWKPALLQSVVFLGFQHGFRMTQEKTRRELNGAFFRDWGKSVKGLRGWKDADNFFTNYIAHPLQGGFTGRIFVNNSDRSKNLEFGKSKKYWESRFKAFVWSAAWSAQFELGPISEASIGNVGMRTKNGKSTMAWGDLVVTPTLGTGVLIVEDALDKYVLKNWLEKKINNKFLIKMFRIVFTPTTSVANMFRLKKPSWRENRPLL